MVANEILTRLLEFANHVLPEEASRTPGAQPFLLPQRVLVVPSHFIGDNILLTPFIRHLRENLGGSARLDVAATPAIAPLYETLPGIDCVHIEKRGELRNPKSFLEQEGYDTLIMCRYAPLWAHAAVRAEVPQRVGYDLERLGIHRLKRWGQSLTHTIPSTSMFDEQPQVEIYLDILRHLGMQAGDNRLICRLTPADHQRAEALLAGASRPRILIHAGSGSPGKNWPLPHWEQLLTVLQRRFDPVFVTVGGAGEKGLYAQWEERYPFINLCGQTHLRESVAVLERMDLVITLDTSVAHMAALAGTPRLVVLYGPTNERQWRPRVKPGTVLEQVHLDLACRPCPARTCEHKSCMKELSVGRVLLAVERACEQNPLPQP